MNSPSSISSAIHSEALRLGFSACGFSKAEELVDAASGLKTWLEEERHAGMSYMQNHFEKRINPTILVDGAKSVISVLLNYYSDHKQSDPEAPIISKYAYGTDYHYIIKDKLKSLYAFIDSHYGPIAGRYFVDSAPVLDKYWAKKAGLGWIGKNSNLINPKLGSFFFIGEIIIDLELQYNKEKVKDYCGNCTACIDACPTSAILSNRTINSNRCISYLTIEHKGDIPEEFIGKMQNRAFGCDICQDVCPWNKKAIINTIPEFKPIPELLNLSKQDWLNMSKSQFKSFFTNSPLMRAGHKKILQNIEFLNKTSS